MAQDDQRNITTTCPACSATYQIALSAIGHEGRTVKCARCGNIWTATSPDASSDAEQTTPGESEALEQQTGQARGGDEENRQEHEDRQGEEQRDGQEEGSPEGQEDQPGAKFNPNGSRSFLKVLKRGGKTKRGRAAGGLRLKAKGPWAKLRSMPGQFLGLRRVAGYFLLLIALGLFGTAALARNSLVTIFPDLASLFETVGLESNTRGITFGDLQAVMLGKGRERGLQITGSLYNISGEMVALPQIRLSLRDTGRQEIYAWTVEPDQKTLQAGEVYEFATHLSMPPQIAIEVAARFIGQGGQ